MGELKRLDDVRVLCRPDELRTFDTFVVLWLEMHRGWEGIPGVMLPVGQASRCLDSMQAAGMPERCPEHVELSRHLAEALDGAHLHFMTLARVSGELAALVHTVNSTAPVQTNPAVRMIRPPVTRERAKVLWREMYRLGAGIDAAFQPLVRAHRLGKVGALAAPLDAVHAHFQALAGVTLELAAGWHAAVDVASVQITPATPLAGLMQ